MNLDEQYEHAYAHISVLGWLEAAAENGGGWATGMIQREQSGPPKVLKAWIPPGGVEQDQAVERFLKSLLGSGRGASRVQISRALWGREPENGKVGIWLGNDPIIPKVGGVLRADLDIAEGHKAPDGQRLPTMREALSAVALWHATFGWGRALHVYNSGGGLTVVTRHPDAEALIERWVLSWRAVAERGGWYLDVGACRGHGGLRVAGSLREGVRIDGTETSLITTPRPISVIDRGPMAVHEVWTLQPEGGAHLEHRLPEVPEEDKPWYGDEEYGDATGDAPWDRMASAVPASTYIERVYGWSREGLRLRQPGSTRPDTWIGDGEVELIYPHSPSDATALGLPEQKGATSFALLGAALDDDWSLAARLARHFDGRWGDLLAFVIEHDGDLVTASHKVLGKTAREKKALAAEHREIVKAFNALYRSADLGADPREYPRASDAARAYARRRKADPYEVMEALIEQRLAEKS